MSKKLGLSFYEQDTIEVAKQLLGKVLVHQKENGSRFAGVIVETEAYLGIEDPACHTFGNKITQKTQSMYFHGGHAYVYLIYGMYYCFNVVTKTPDHPEAVLVRALEPIEGLEKMRSLRKKNKPRDLASGPGKLCQAMEIDKTLDGLSLVGSQIFIEDNLDINADKLSIIECPRIGVDYSGDAAQWPLRFCIENSPFISVPYPSVSHNLTE